LFSFNFSYRDPLLKLDKSLSWSLNLRSLDGLNLGQVGISKKLGSSNSVSLDYKAFIRQNETDLSYLIYPGDWKSGKWNNTLNATFSNNWSGYKSTGNVSLQMRTTAPGSSYAWSGMSVEAQHSIYGKKSIFRLRGYVAFLGGSDIPLESKVFLAGANPEKMMENKFVRSWGFVPSAWTGFGENVGHFQHGGGLNIRGYNGYLSPKNTDSEQVFFNAGNAGASVSIEWDLSRFFKFKPKKVSNYVSLSPYLFADGGYISKGAKTLLTGATRADAGVGTLLTIKSWGPLQKPAPLVLRFDMPLYLSDIPYTEKSNFAFRWLVGVGRSF
jgi:aminopeptidase N